MLYPKVETTSEIKTISIKEIINNIKEIISKSINILKSKQNLILFIEKSFHF